ncbi:hypothetical protein [Gryllotalpicola koreensis]|uniref:Uncharacterized protein n=1 Tax=Gryllotalpicola koreensis TaxID=993086 RepID=A0ABP7ZXD9_9MICO
MIATIATHVAAVAVAAAIGGTSLTGAGATGLGDIHPTVVDKGWFSVQETITNNTNVDWTFNAQNTSEGLDNHWQQRPQQVLKAHTSEVVSDYTDDGVDGESLQVAYTMPNGDYVVSLYQASMSELPEFDPTFTGVFTANPVNTYPPQDKAYTVTDNPGSGYRTDASFAVSAVS